MRTLRSLVLAAMIVVVALAFAAPIVGASSVPDSPLAESPLGQCYARCEAAIFLSLDFCMKACRCSVGIEFCPSPGTWDDLQQARAIR